MTKKEFNDVQNEIINMYRKAQQSSTTFFLSAVAIDQDKIKTFDHIPLIVKTCWDKKYLALHDTWIDNHINDWPFSWILQDDTIFMNLDTSYKYRKVYWGRTMQEAYDVMKYCIDTLLTQLQTKIKECQEDYDYFNKLMK